MKKNNEEEKEEKSETRIIIVVIYTKCIKTCLILGKQYKVKTGICWWRWKYKTRKRTWKRRVWTVNRKRNVGHNLGFEVREIEEGKDSLNGNTRKDSEERQIEKKNEKGKL